MSILMKLNPFLSRSTKTITQSTVQIHKSNPVSVGNETWSLRTLVNEPVIFSSNYGNRNPRSLEWTGHQYKRFGWNLQYPPKDYYHRCVFKRGNASLSAQLWHHSGELLISISTNDPEFREHLYSAKDTSAAVNLARVFADRCLQYGITHMDYFKELSFEKSEREKKFYDTLIKCGLVMQEPAFVERPDTIPGLDYEEKNYYHEQRNVPFPPVQNKFIREKILKNL